MFETCQYIISAVSKEQFPNHNGFSEFVFLGRSNVGKSSLINALANRKLLAKTSSKPGKTQTINFFLIDESFYLVDVPGYGYAAQSLKMREKFGQIIETYLEDNKHIKRAFLLVDTKVGPTKDDRLMYEYLKYLELPITVVTTKSDKIGSTHLLKHKKKVLETFPNADVILTSSAKRQGLNQIIGIIKNNN